MKKTLPVFSYILHPIFISVYAALFYFFINDSYFSDTEKYTAILQIVILTVIAPVLLYFILRFSGKINSIMVAEISQRKTPLLIICFITVFLIRQCITITHFPELYFFFLGGLLSTFAALTLLFFKIKASLHMISISTLTVFAFGLTVHNQSHNIIAIAILILLNGFVASSRLEMKAHSPKELSIGLLLGIIPQALLFYFWL